MLEVKPKLSHIQKLTTAKSVKPEEGTAEMNVDSPKANSLSKKVLLYDRTKLDSKSNDFRQLKDDGDHGQLNIIETGGLYSTSNI